MLSISSVLPGTQSDCRRETQSPGDRCKMEARMAFLLLSVKINLLINGHMMLF
jgi:hypothetical protein